MVRCSLLLFILSGCSSDKVEPLEYRFADQVARWNAISDRTEQLQKDLEEAREEVAEVRRQQSRCINNIVGLRVELDFLKVDVCRGGNCLGHTTEEKEERAASTKPY